MSDVLLAETSVCVCVSLSLVLTVLHTFYLVNLKLDKLTKLTRHCNFYNCSKRFIFNIH